MLDIRAVATHQDVHRLAVLRVPPKLLHRFGATPAAPALLRLGQQLERAIQFDLERVVALLEGAEVALVHHVWPVAADPHLHRLAAVRVAAQLQRHGQELQRLLEGHVLVRQRLRQGRAPRLSVLLAGLAELHVRAVPAGEQEHGLTGLRIGAERLGTAGLPLQQRDRLLVGQVRRGHPLGDGGGEGLAVAVHLHERTVAADPDPWPQVLQLDGGGRSRIDPLLALFESPLQPVLARIEIGQVGAPVHLSGGDPVQRVFHGRREPGVHQIREVLLQEAGDGEGDEGRNQLLALALGVAALLDGGDDGRVGAGAADPLGLERLHERGLGVARRRLRLVTHRLQGAEIRLVAFVQLRQQHLLVLQRGLGVVGALHVGPEEAGELQDLAGGAEDRVLGLQEDGQVPLPRVGHLAGHRPLPDQVVERPSAAGEAQLLRGGHAGPGRPDRLVRLLRPLGLGPEPPRRLAQVLVSVQIPHLSACRPHGLLRELDGIRPHVGDEPALVEALGRPHGVARAEVQLAVRLLLEAGRGERSVRAARGPPLLHRRDPKGRLGQALPEGLGLLSVQEHDLPVRAEPPGPLVEVATGGQGTTAEAGQIRGERPARRLQLGPQVPPGGRVERAPLPLPLHQEPHGHRLHAPGRETGLDLLPEERGEAKTHQAVQDAPGLLRLHPPHVDLAGVLQGLQDGVPGDLVEGDPPEAASVFPRVAELLGHVEGDRLAFPVRVGGQQHGVGRAGGLPELLEDGSLSLDGNVLRLEAVLHVHAEPALRQVANVTHRGLHHVLVAKVRQIPFQRPCLGGRLHDDQMLHGRSDSPRTVPVSSRPPGPTS